MRLIQIVAATSLCLSIAPGPAESKHTEQLTGGYCTKSGKSFNIQRLPNKQLKFVGSADFGTNRGAYIYGLARESKDSSFIFKRGKAKLILHFYPTSKLIVTHEGDQNTGFKFDKGVDLDGAYKKVAQKPTFKIDCEDTPWQSQ